MAVDYLFIVRHGDTKPNEKGVEPGPLPHPLSKKGRKEVAFLSKALSKVKIRAIYSSPIFRAVETAEILAKPHGLEVKLVDELTDVAIRPELVGKKGSHHILTDPEDFLETNDDVLKRTARALDMIEKEATGNVVVVSHGDVITAILERVMERKLAERHYVLHPDAASLSIVETKKRRPTLVLFNYRRKVLSRY